MNKKIFFFLFITLITLGYIFKIDKIILIKFINITDNIKKNYKYYYTNTSDYINKYINQVDTIKQLQNQTKINNEYKLKYLISRYELEKLQNILLTNARKPNIKYVEVLSYASLNDFSKVILNTSENIGNDILALVTKDGQSAGIVLQNKNQVIAYLNQNEKCNYAVFIGDTNAPGITNGANNKNEIIINHIPKWHKLKIGDKVYTSGMDNIFPKGLSVGDVVDVIQNLNTQTAIVKTTKDVLSNNYFYIIKR